MRYITNRRMRVKSISGDVNIPYGKSLDLVGDMLYYHGKPMFVRTSQNARDYVSRDDDNKGKMRGKLVHEIMDMLAKPGEGRQALWDRLWCDKYALKFKAPQFSDYWIWDISFYEASIEDLEYLLARIKNEVEARDGLAEDFEDGEG